MEQQTKEWHELRKTKIGASDAPVIMRVSPWKTPLQLWEEKLGLRQASFQSEKMKRGLELENQAREVFSNEVGYEMKPTVIVSDKYSFMMASLDGISACKRYAVEIKCPGHKDHSVAINDMIPEKYVPQLQHQMLVCNLEMIFYFSYNGSCGKVLEVKRDEDYIGLLIEKETEFWNLWQNLEQPELDKRDYEERTDKDWEFNALSLLAVQKQLKILQEKELEYRNTLISLAGSKNVKGSGITLTRNVRKGAVDYKSIPELIDVNIEKYRKEPIEYWKIGCI